jgi:hypothetical protein
MRYFSHFFSTSLLALAFLFSLSASVSAADRAGEVVVVIGDAQVKSEGGQSHAVARGEIIQSGQMITTGGNGHVQLRMVDGASLVVRASSVLKINEYFVDLVTPSKSRIKVTLEKGVVRSITGRAGEASKESFRLNTPLAAIGIRGTDFVVHATSEVTRVLVQSGAIVMTPISADCSQDTFGPCRSLTSRDLTSAAREGYLELRSRNGVPLGVPVYVAPEKAIESPNMIAPPRPDEPRVGPEKPNNAAALNSSIVDANRTVTVNNIKTQVDTAVKVVVPVVTEPKVETKPVVVPEPKVETKPEPKVDPVVVPVAVVVPTKIWWGRWEAFVTADNQTLKAASADDREILSSNAVYGLLREVNNNFTMPSSGVVAFKLADSESYLLKADKSLTAASILNPSLTIDFGNRKFDTSLSVNVPGMSPIDIQSKGTITFQGYFIGESNSPNTTVDGGLSQNGNQAGYLFQRFLTGDTSVVGVTRWLK